MEIEFISSQWLELAAWTPGLVVYSRPIIIERRRNLIYRQLEAKRDVERLIKSILLSTTPTHGQET